MFPGTKLILEGNYTISYDETYSDVSNPIAGSWSRASVGRDGWGTVYMEQRVVNGFTFSSPARGGSVSREARARSGYLQRFRGCLAIDAFFEKRSFNFTDPQKTDLYTKSSRVGIELSCIF